MLDDCDTSRLVVIKCPNSVDVITDCPDEWSPEEVEKFQEYVLRMNRIMRSDDPCPGPDCPGHFVTISKPEWFGKWVRTVEKCDTCGVEYDRWSYFGDD